MSHLKVRTPKSRRPLLIVLFVIYLVLLVWIVLWKLEVPYIGDIGRRDIKLIPFIAAGGDGASNPLEVVANVAFFVPFGVYLSLLAPSWQWWKSTGVIAGTSLGFEVTQYVLAIGSTDTSDLIANTAGGLAGIGLLQLARYRLQARTERVMAGICLIGTVLAVGAVALVVASPLQYGPPGDRPPRPHTPGSVVETNHP